MEKSIKISNSEWDIMEILWDNNPLSSKEIIEKIEQKRDWKPTTIKTLISRLVDKNVIDYEKRGKSYYYYPLMNKEDCINARANRFVNKFYKGELKAMIASFIEEYEFSNEEINELKEILDKKKN
ncbi:BlaI/MecI/CopY family transcriptional regulator [Tissierella praeacuta]|uniref:BlaI/MecI/CopY family transcriptional regulator n=1 Tax=Tissierella praeacuta TaxID=43131 RepID=UPI00334026DC